MNVLYLHGFASSPQSSKATFFSERFAERGVSMQTPDLNLPDFSTLTVSRMLGQVDETLDRFPTGPAVVIGSSLGGLVAVHSAARHPARVQALVLLAPALDFGPATVADLGPQGLSLAEWKRAGTLDVYHYSYERTLPIHYELFEDAARYDAARVNLPMPVLIFQGRKDDAVDPASVERWARPRPNVELHMLDDDHQLGKSFRYIWVTLAAFLSIG
jgi:pimeloyl-ACP methyl ester carboxylesterase